jgi:hypothetical protein
LLLYRIAAQNHKFCRGEAFGRLSIGQSYNLYFQMLRPPHDQTGRSIRIEKYRLSSKIARPNADAPSSLPQRFRPYIMPPICNATHPLDIEGVPRESPIAKIIA